MVDAARHIVSISRGGQLCDYLDGSIFGSCRPRLLLFSGYRGCDGTLWHLVAPCDVYDVYVVRKQLYISDEHERALKARARELGVSEAELVRRMLDGLLLDGEGGRGLAGAGAAEALEGFLEEADRLAESHRFQRGYVFDRNELYEDRA
jgi:hypothetical protein